METKNKSGQTEGLGAAELKEPFFSIIVPVFNVESYLEKCVCSLTEQEPAGGELEILLVDDGSTDESGRLADQLAARYEQVKVFHKENAGLSSARNYGIERASGAYVLFVDSDDYAAPELCRRIWEALERHGMADAVCYDGVEHGSHGETSTRRVPVAEERCTESGKKYLLEHYKSRTLSVEAWMYAYKRSFLMEQDLRFREGRLHEDVEFTPRALLACKKVIELPDGLYHYVVRENSISTQKDKGRNIGDLFVTLQEQCEVAEQQEPELRKWMKNAALDSYLNMVQYARMYQPRYRKLLDKRFLMGKAATRWNHFRVLLCLINVRLYCLVNDCYKYLRK